MNLLLLLLLFYSYILYLFIYLFTHFFLKKKSYIYEYDECESRTCEPVFPELFPIIHECHCSEKPFELLPIPENGLAFKGLCPGFDVIFNRERKRKRKEKLISKKKNF